MLHVIIFGQKLKRIFNYKMLHVIFFCLLLPFASYASSCLREVRPIIRYTVTNPTNSTLKVPVFNTFFESKVPSTRYMKLIWNNEIAYLQCYNGFL